MKVTINPYNPRTPREHKELINQIVGHEKAPRQRGSGKYLDNAILPYSGW